MNEYERKRKTQAIKKRIAWDKTVEIKKRLAQDFENEKIEKEMKAAQQLDGLRRRLGMSDEIGYIPSASYWKPSDELRYLKERLNGNG